MTKLSPPRIVCAANKYTTSTMGSLIIPGARHHDTIMNSILIELLDTIVHGVAEQGFIDQHGKFYTREEAWIIARDNNQIIQLVGNQVDLSENYKLYSENLY